MLWHLKIVLVNALSGFVFRFHRESQKLKLKSPKAKAS